MELLCVRVVDMIRYSRRQELVIIEKKNKTDGITFFHFVDYFTIIIGVIEEEYLLQELILLLLVEYYEGYFIVLWT